MHRSLAVLAALTLAVSLPAQTAPAPGAPVAAAARSGIITGKVFNPATGEYVRNAQIRVVETGATTISEAEGAFRLGDLPAGPLTLVVNYTGYRSVTATVDVAASGATVKNFELVSTLQESTKQPDGTVKLSAFTVSTEREGDSRRRARAVQVFV